MGEEGIKLATWRDDGYLVVVLVMDRDRVARLDHVGVLSTHATGEVQQVDAAPAASSVAAIRIRVVRDQDGVLVTEQAADQESPIAVPEPVDQCSDQVPPALR